MSPALSRSVERKIRLWIMEQERERRKREEQRAPKPALTGVRPTSR